MKKIIIFSFILALFGLTPNSSRAADIIAFDSTDNYLGACRLTNKSEWELTQDLTITKFQIWYNWSQGETTLPVKVFQNGKLFAEFSATRGNCDPYQNQWCNADFVINKVFPQGKYTTEIPNSRQCLKPGGTGTVRLYKDDQTPVKATSSPTPSSTTPPVTTSTSTDLSPKTTCPCSKPVVVVTTAAVSAALTSILVTILLKKLIKI